MVAAMTALAAVAVLSSALVPSLKTLMLLAAALLGLRAVMGLLRPGLCLRIIDDRLEYRSLRQGASWRAVTPGIPCFVSPWYLGWRGRGLTRVGIFRDQVEAECFRRLAVLLRHQAPS